MIRRILEWMKVKINKLKLQWTYSKCYNYQEYMGHAIFGMCGGIVGDYSGTDYLDEFCMNCPYYSRPPLSSRRGD